MIFSSPPAISILMVCTANICRSPMAEGLMRKELVLHGLHRKVRLDSAGTRATQPGHMADGRAQRICAREGIDLRKCRARQVTQADFASFDYLIALDTENLQWLLENCPTELQAKVSLLGSWVRQGELGDIPDPYYGSTTGFEQVLSLLHHCVDGLLVHIVQQLKRAPGQTEKP